MWGIVQSPGTSTQSSVTIHTMRVAPMRTRTSPTWEAPATIWSQRASTVPPATWVLEPGIVPADCPIGTTSGIWERLTPAAARYSANGDPSPPVPTHNTRAAFSFFWPSIVTSGMMRWRE